MSDYSRMSRTLTKLFVFDSESFVLMIRTSHIISLMTIFFCCKKWIKNRKL